MYKREIVKLDIIKIENFCSVKETVKRMKRQATDWNKIFAEHVSDKTLISIKDKTLLKLNKGKTQLR